MFPEKDAKDVSLFTVVIDFDGTIAESTWPSNEIGAPIQSGVAAVLHYFELGNEIVIHTARPESHAGLIWRWLRDNGLNGVVHDVVTGKPRGWVYIDDRAWNPTTPAAPVAPAEPEEPQGLAALTDPTEVVKAARRFAREPSPEVKDEERRRAEARARKEQAAWETMD